MSAEPGTLGRALGVAVRRARHSRGLTQGDLAGRLGVTRATVASYETGRRPIPAEALLRIARICGQPLAFFELAREGEEAIPQGNAGPPVSAEQVVSATPQRRAALDALISALELRPDAIPITLEFVEAYIQDTAPGRP